jgi:hypothetical protein
MRLKVELFQQLFRARQKRLHILIREKARNAEVAVPVELDGDSRASIRACQGLRERRPLTLST